MTFFCMSVCIVLYINIPCMVGHRYHIIPKNENWGRNAEGRGGWELF